MSVRGKIRIQHRGAFVEAAGDYAEIIRQLPGVCAALRERDVRRACDFAEAKRALLLRRFQPGRNHQAGSRKAGSRKAAQTRVKDKQQVRNNLPTTKTERRKDEFYWQKIRRERGGESE